MGKNLGKTDRLMRLALAFILGVYALWQGSWIAAAFALFTLYEAIASWCLVYQLLGKNSCPIDVGKN